MIREYFFVSYFSCHRILQFQGCKCLQSDFKKKSIKNLKKNFTFKRPSVYLFCFEVNFQIFSLESSFCLAAAKHPFSTKAVYAVKIPNEIKYMFCLS